MKKSNKSKGRNFLVSKIRDADLNGAGKTKKNNVTSAKRFAFTLYELGYKVHTWKNIRNNHVFAVVKKWKQQGLTTTTIKSYLSGVRAVAKGFENYRIHEDNIEFGLGRRNYIATQSKAISDEAYEKVVVSLQQGNERCQRIAAQMKVMRGLGLRHEEARKMNPKLALLEDGRIYISAGTKGGRDRVINNPTAEQRNAVKELTPFIGTYGNSWPDNMTEGAWEKAVYKVLSRHGLSIKSCGASLHGLRHAFAHSRYQELTNIQAPCLYSTPAEYRQAAYSEHGENWRVVHDQAINIITHELGHNRSDVTVVYLGSIHG